MRKIPIDKRGFSFLEIIICLAVISILVSALVPVVASKLEDARIGRARDDVQMIAIAIGKFYIDTSLFPVWEDGSSIGAPGCHPDYDVLASADGEYPAGMSARGWSTTEVDTLEDQLVLNKPGYHDTGTNCWRGPYLSINRGKRLNKDPWGNRYLVNVKGLYIPKTAVMVISAGPNELIETNATQCYKDFRIGGDDIVCTIR